MSPNLLKIVAKPHLKAYREVLKQIKAYDRIIIFRHQMPDYDAIGTQLGLAHWIKDNFPHKTVLVTGKDHVVFTPRLFPKMDCLDDGAFAQPFLAIVVDTANADRIDDDRYQKAAYIIKIDHHPARENYGNINIVDAQLASASELVANMLLLYPCKYRLNREAAKFLYIALAGDSGRFMFNSTSPHTFEIAKRLLERGFSLSRDVYQKMYQKELQDLRVTAYVLGNFKISPHGVAYYVLSEDVQNELHITVERGKENLGQFGNLADVPIWCSITEDRARNRWKVSIRSKELAIDGVASQYKGGGHAQASGAEIATLDELPELIAALDQLIVSSK